MEILRVYSDGGQVCMNRAAAERGRERGLGGYLARLRCEKKNKNHGVFGFVSAGEEAGGRRSCVCSSCGRRRGGEGAEEEGAVPWVR